MHEFIYQRWKVILKREKTSPCRQTNLWSALLISICCYRYWFTSSRIPEIRKVSDTNSTLLLHENSRDNLETSLHPRFVREHRQSIPASSALLDLSSSNTFQQTNDRNRKSETFLLLLTLFHPCFDYKDQLLWIFYCKVCVLSLVWFEASLRLFPQNPQGWAFPSESLSSCCKVLMLINIYFRTRFEK